MRTRVQPSPSDVMVVALLAALGVVVLLTIALRPAAFPRTGSPLDAPTTLPTVPTVAPAGTLAPAPTSGSVDVTPAPAGGGTPFRTIAPLESPLPVETGGAGGSKPDQPPPGYHD